MSRFGRKYVIIIGLFVCMFFFIGLTGKGSAADVVIVSIDIQRVFEAHPALREAMAKFQAQAGEMQKKLLGIENEEERVNAQIQMQEQMREVAINLQEEAFNKMRADVQKFAKQKGYTYVISQTALIVGGKDVTEEVIASFKKAVPVPEKR